MNPQANQSQQQPMAFTDAHNAIYNGLRDVLMRHQASGVPGMDKVVNALNKAHQEGMMNYQPSRPRPMAATQMPATPQNQIGQLSSMMQQIRQKNAPQLPNGYNAYS